MKNITEQMQELVAERAGRILLEQIATHEDLNVEKAVEQAVSEMERKLRGFPLLHKQTLSVQQFADQMEAERPHLTREVDWVVIRGVDGDYGLAAVHTDGDRLVFDLGHKIKESQS